MDHSNWHPHLTVATVIERDNKYLMVEEAVEDVGQTVINQPAGHLEQYETLQAAAIRETLEETGYEVSIDGLIGCYLYTSPANGVTYFRVCFSASVIKQRPDYRLDTGIIGPRWLSLDELRSSTVPMRSELVVRCIEDYQQRPQLPVEYLHHAIATAPA